MTNQGKNIFYVLDTHVLIWYFIGSVRLQKKLKEKIDTTRNRGGRLLVPTIVLAEALDIAEKGRVEFDFDKGKLKRYKRSNEPNSPNVPNDQRIHALPYQRNNAIDDENNTGCWSSS